MNHADFRNVTPATEREWADKIRLHAEGAVGHDNPDAAFDQHVMADILNDTNQILKVNPDNDHVVNIARMPEAQEFKVVRLYPEGPSVLTMAPALLAGLDAAARRWPRNLDWTIYAWFTGDLDTQAEKLQAWLALYGDQFTMRKVRTSTGVEKWQGEGPLRTMRNVLRDVVARLEPAP